MRQEYGDLISALDAATFARATIGQNRGYDKELARESYESVVGEELVPKMEVALELLVGDLDARDVERLAQVLIKFIEKTEG